MDQLVDAAQQLAERFGGVGLAVIAFLDSSFVSLPNVNDLLIVMLTMKHPDRWVYYAGMTTLGSVAGTLVIYWIGRKGGEAFLRKRFRPDRVERVLRVFGRYGAVAMCAVAIVPPPAPYKIFVLLAGVGGVGPGMFALAVAAGRALRYGAEGLLARWYGEQAASFIRENLFEVALWLAAVLVGAALAVLTWRRRQARQAA